MADVKIEPIQLTLENQNEAWGLVWMRNGELYAGAINLVAAPGWVQVRVPSELSQGQQWVCLLPREDVREIEHTTPQDVASRHDFTI